MKWPMKTVQTIKKTVAAVTPTTTAPRVRRERTGGYWPDDDLAELEADYRPSWLGPRRKDWLKR